jgi:orotidine-5'-phosphate decarboxylase
LNCNGKPLYQHVALAVGEWSQQNLGQYGLGDVGAVVGATHPAELAEVRKLLPDVWFLLPGFGAQGATAKDVAAAFRPDGLGAIVSSSRGITFPFPPDDPNWEAAIEAAARATVKSLPSIR